MTRMRRLRSAQRWRSRSRLNRLPKSDLVGQDTPFVSGERWRECRVHLVRIEIDTRPAMDQRAPRCSLRAAKGEGVSPVLAWNVSSLRATEALDCICDVLCGRRISAHALLRAELLASSPNAYHDRRCVPRRVTLVASSVVHSVDTADCFPALTA